MSVSGIEMPKYVRCIKDTPSGGIAGAIYSAYVCGSAMDNNERRRGNWLDRDFFEGWTFATAKPGDRIKHALDGDGAYHPCYLVEKNDSHRELEWQARFIAEFKDGCTVLAQILLGDKTWIPDLGIAPMKMEKTDESLATPAVCGSYYRYLGKDGPIYLHGAIYEFRRAVEYPFCAWIPTAGDRMRKRDMTVALLAPSPDLGHWLCHHPGLKSIVLCEWQPVCGEKPVTIMAAQEPLKVGDEVEVGEIPEDALWCGKPYFAISSNDRAIFSGRRAKIKVIIDGNTSEATEPCALVEGRGFWIPLRAMRRVTPHQADNIKISVGPSAPPTPPPEKLVDTKGLSGRAHVMDMLPAERKMHEASLRRGLKPVGRCGKTWVDGGLVDDLIAADFQIECDIKKQESLIVNAKEVIAMAEAQLLKIRRGESRPESTK